MCKFILCGWSPGLAAKHTGKTRRLAAGTPTGARTKEIYSKIIRLANRIRELKCSKLNML